MKANHPSVASNSGTNAINSGGAASLRDNNNSAEVDARAALNGLVNATQFSSHELGKANNLNNHTATKPIITTPTTTTPTTTAIKTFGMQRLRTTQPGVRIIEIIKTSILINGHKAITTIDCGAAGDFISNSFINKLKSTTDVETKALKNGPMSVQWVNASGNNQITESACVNFNPHTGANKQGAAKKRDFFVMNLDKSDVVLGMPFLVDYAAKIDFGTGSIKVVDHNVGVNKNVTTVEEQFKQWLKLKGKEKENAQQGKGVREHGGVDKGKNKRRETRTEHRALVDYKLARRAKSNGSVSVRKPVAGVNPQVITDLNIIRVLNAYVANHAQSDTVYVYSALSF